jgi:hypothetical protein
MGRCGARPWPPGCRWSAGAGNLPHLAAHGREGLLADPGDVDALAAARPTWSPSAALFFAALREAADAQATGPA